MIIFVNGSINSGKTTVAKLLQKALPNTALLEIDALREMVSWMPLEDSIPLNFSNAVSVITNFVRAGLNVVVPYPLSQSNHEYLKGSLETLGTDMYFFTLAPSLETALSNRGKRVLTENEKERIAHHYRIGIPNPSFGEMPVPRLQVAGTP